MLQLFYQVWQVFLFCKLFVYLLNYLITYLICRTSYRGAFAPNNSFKKFGFWLFLTREKIIRPSNYLGKPWSFEHGKTRGKLIKSYRIPTLYFAHAQNIRYKNIEQNLSFVINSKAILQDRGFWKFFLTHWLTYWLSLTSSRGAFAPKNLCRWSVQC